MKKILCAEALWDMDISQKRQSYRSALDIIRSEAGCETAYFTFNTPEELNHIFEIFIKKNYDVLYIASHMSDGDIVSGFKSKYRISYSDLLEKYAKGLKNKVIHLAGCSSMSDSNMSNFDYLLEKTGAKIISGYTIDTFTTESACMDILYLTTLLQEGVGTVRDTIYTRYGQLAEVSGFKLHVRSIEGDM